MFTCYLISSFILLFCVKKTSTISCSSQYNSNFANAMDCIKDNIPTPDFPITAPSVDQVLNWNYYVEQMILSTTTCPEISSGELFSIYVIDEINNYCILNEINPSTIGFGTFVKKKNHNSEIHIQIPHPIFDSKTFEEGYKVFDSSPSVSSALFAGTHRHCSQIASTCQSSYKESDVAHNIENMFHETVKTVAKTINDRDKMFFIQFHGKASSSCNETEVFLTSGSTGDSPIVNKLVNIIEEKRSEWKISTPNYGPGSACGLKGTTNVAGRYLKKFYSSEIDADNMNECSTSVSIPGNIFMHIEQSYDIRMNPMLWVEILDELAPYCQYGCVNGVCSSHYTCNCTSGWKGINCSETDDSNSDTDDTNNDTDDTNNDTDDTNNDTDDTNNDTDDTNNDTDDSNNDTSNSTDIQTPFYREIYFIVIVSVFGVSVFIFCSCASFFLVYCVALKKKNRNNRVLQQYELKENDS